MMRTVFVACFLAVLCVALARKVCDPELIESVNRAGHPWQAGCSPRFHGRTMEEVRRTLMRAEHVHPRPIQLPARALGAAVNAPDTFDARQQWPSCIHPIRDQQQCGSCWAFAASEALSDRFCIASNGSVNVVLSPQDLVSCDTTNMGCSGGRLDSVWTWMVKHGVAADSCIPYTSGSGSAPPCPKTCTDGSAIKRYQAKNSYHVGSSILFWRRVEDIQNEILMNGPVETGFEVYEDFMNYKSGVYHHTTGSLLGGHAVKIIGWGSEGGVDYWLVANSWSTQWGLDGFFKIRRGHNECGIEADVYAGEPNI